MKRLNIEEVKELFNEIGYILLTDTYTNTKTKLNYICDKGHKGEATFSSFKHQKSRCSKCVQKRLGVNRRLNIEEVKELFNNVGLTLIDTEYKNATQKMNYVCKFGHTGSKVVTSVMTGSGCRICGLIKRSKTRSIDIQRIKHFCDRINYTLLSDEYIHSSKPLIVKCDKNHIYNPSWDMLRSGSKCGICWSLKDKTKHNSPIYNSAISEEERLRNRNYPELIEWRKAIYKRDDYTCQCCGDFTGHNLNAHHIVSYAKNPEFRTDITNGITLCKSCHLAFHNAYKGLDFDEWDLWSFIESFELYMFI